MTQLFADSLTRTIGENVTVIVP